MVAESWGLETLHLDQIQCPPAPDPRNLAEREPGIPLRDSGHSGTGHKGASWRRPDLASRPLPLSRRTGFVPGGLCLGLPGLPGQSLLVLLVCNCVSLLFLNCSGTRLGLKLLLLFLGPCLLFPCWQTGLWRGERTKDLHVNA